MTNSPVQGQYLGEKEYKTHRRIQLKSAGASALEHSRPVEPDEDGMVHTREAKIKIDTTPDIFTPLLKEIDDALDERNATSTVIGPLVFVTPPSVGTPAPPVADAMRQDVNAGHLSLRYNNSLNHATIVLEEYLLTAYIQIESGLQHEDASVRNRTKAVMDRISNQLDEVDHLKRREWDRQKDLGGALPEDRGHVNVNVLDTASYCSRPLAQGHPTVVAWYLLVSVLYLLCGLSIMDCRLVMVFAHVVLKSLQNSNAGNGADIASEIPRDVRTVLDKLPIHPVTQAYVCCPKCFACYLYDGNSASYPKHCTHRNTESSQVCNQLLKESRVFKGATRSMPSSLFLYQSMRHWVARLVCRPGIEEKLSNQVAERSPDLENLGYHDIWDSPDIRNLESHDGQPFIFPQGNEGRLVFSLNVDGFNPYRSLQAGKKETATAIWMACLNLPIEIRMKPEYMFLVGVVSGKPSLDEINHVLRPLVDDLILLWREGIFLSETPVHSSGRHFRCALLPLVCDTLGARQTAGFGSHSFHLFCAYCYLTLDDIENLRVDSWKFRSHKEHLEAANEWRSAKSDDDRNKVFDRTGVRYSELLRLPYWRPVGLTVVDLMHIFGQGSLQRHCRKVWGMNIKVEDGDGTTFDGDTNGPRVSEDEMRAAHHTLQHGPHREIQKMTPTILRRLCRNLTLRYAGKKKKLIERLHAYRLEKQYCDVDGKPLSPPFEALPEDREDAPGIMQPPPIPQSHGAQTPLEHLTHPASAPSLVSQVDAQVLTNTEDSDIQDALTVLRTKSSPSSLRRLGRVKLVLVCSSVLEPDDELYNSKRLTIDKMVARLTTWRSDHQEKPLDVPSVQSSSISQHAEKTKGTEYNTRGDAQTPRQKRPKKTCVLGRNTLAEVRNDMKRLRLPSHVNSAPLGVGSARTGKLSADQWLSFVLINLVFTIIRLWGGEAATSRKHQMLVNFMDLVIATKLAYFRCTTTQTIADFRFHMKRYLDEMLKLFPGAKVYPVQHLALHFADFMETLGPSHAYRCYAFERGNWLLQRIPTNSRVGELEQTMLRRFCQGQNLHDLFSRQHIPEALGDLIPAFEKAFRHHKKGTLFNDGLAFAQFDDNDAPDDDDPSDGKLTDLSDDVLLILQDWMKTHGQSFSDIHPRGIFLRRLEHLGKTLQPASSSLGESTVIFKFSDREWNAGSIREIFTHSHKGKSAGDFNNTFLVVDAYVPLSNQHSKLDHYRKFSYSAGGRLFYNRFLPDPVLLRKQDILCHSGAISDLEVEGIADRCIWVLPLNKSPI